MPMEERHTCLGKLQKADKILIEGVRVYHREASLVLDQTGRIVNKRFVTPAKGRESCAGTIPAKSPILIWTKGPEPMPAKPQIEVSRNSFADGTRLNSVCRSSTKPLGSPSGRDVTTRKSASRCSRCSTTKTTDTEGECHSVALPASVSPHLRAASTARGASSRRSSDCSSGTSFSRPSPARSRRRSKPRR